MLKATLIVTWMALPTWHYAAQPTVPPDAPSPPPQRPEESDSKESAEGLWPSPKLLELMLARWAETVSDELDLDTSQRGRVREAVTKRWGKFLEENRGRIQPLVNEYLELRMELVPPDKQRVQAWAERAMPVFAGLRQELDGTVEEVRGLVDPQRRAKFELQALELGVGLEVAEQKLQQWRSGAFDEGQFWIPTNAKLRDEWARNRHEEAEKAREGVRRQIVGADTDQVAAELDGWERYVAEFMDYYDLKEGQRDAARSVLSELKERALAHRDSRHEEIDALERRIRANTGTEGEIAEIKASLVELYGPIDEMFRELKARLEAIPTSAQRTAREPARNDNES